MDVSLVSLIVGDFEINIVSDDRYFYAYHAGSRSSKATSRIGAALSNEIINGSLGFYAGTFVARAFISLLVRGGIKDDTRTVSITNLIKVGWAAALCRCIESVSASAHGFRVRIYVNGTVFVGTRDTGNYSLAMLNVRVRSRKTVA